MSDATHVKSLDDKSKPWKRVWKTESGLYVKTHAVLRANTAFGRLKWDITGALCDASGKAKVDAAGKTLVHNVLDGVTLQSDGPCDIEAQFDTVFRRVIARVEIAELHRQAAAKFGGLKPAAA